MSFCLYFKEADLSGASGDYRKYSQVLTVSFSRLSIYREDKLANEEALRALLISLTMQKLVLFVGVVYPMTTVIEKLSWIAQMILVVGPLLPFSIFHLI